MGSGKKKKKRRAAAGTFDTAEPNEISVRNMPESDAPSAPPANNDCCAAASADPCTQNEVVKEECTDCARASAESDEPDTDKPRCESSGDTMMPGDNDAVKTQEQSRFAKSLSEFSFADTGAASRPRRRGPDILRLGTITILCVICAASSLSLIRNVYDKYRSEKIYDNIASGVNNAFNIGSDTQTDNGIVTLLASDTQSPFTPTMEDIIKNGLSSGANQSERSYAAELERMRASLNSLKNINPDIYAWISVPGTSINYPVAQSDDNVYYLDHAYTGDNLVNGSIFADYRCAPYIPNNRNTVMYGHNITSGAMFHAVEDFFREDVFNNSKIYIYTFDGIFVFKPFSIHETSYDSGFIDTYFESDEKFVAFLNELRDKSDVKSDAELNADSRILTMSTCTNGVSTRRYALHSVLVETITK